MDPSLSENFHLFQQFMNYLQANGSPLPKNLQQNEINTPRNSPFSIFPTNNSTIDKNINPNIHQNTSPRNTPVSVSRNLNFNNVSQSSNIPVLNLESLPNPIRESSEKSPKKRIRSKSTPQPVNKSINNEQIQSKVQTNVIPSTKIGWLTESGQEKYFFFLDKDTVRCLPCGTTILVKNKSQYNQHITNKSHLLNIAEYIKLNILPFEEQLKEHEKTKLRMFLVCIFTGMSFYSATKYRKFFKLIMFNHGHLSGDYQTLTDNASIIYGHLKLLLQGLFKDKSRYCAIQFDGSSYYGYEVNNIICYFRNHDKTFQFLLSMCFDKKYPDADTLSNHLINTVKEFDISPTQICSITSDDANLCSSTRTKFKINYGAVKALLLKDLCHPLDSIMKDVFSFAPINSLTSSVTKLFKKNHLSIIQSFKNYFIEKVKNGGQFSKIYFPKKPKAWNSTYLMLSKLVKLYTMNDDRNITYLQILYEWLQTEDISNTKIKTSLKNCLDSIETENHLSLGILLEVVVVHLKKIYDWIDFLQGNKYVLIHKVKEIIKKVLSMFNQQDLPEETKKVYELRTSLFAHYKKNLLKHFKTVVHVHAVKLLEPYNELENLLDVAHLCDPIQAKQNTFNIEFNYNKWKEILQRYIQGEDREFKNEFKLYKNKIEEITPLPSKTTEEMMKMTKLERYKYWLERCPRKWWLENYNEFPKLAGAVLTVFDIGVSSAESERSHSATRLLIKPQRSSMSPSLVEKIRFIQQNLFFFYPDLFEKDYKNTI